ncbi:hypothetical protein ACTFIR_011878 [Dictyostelium discoideum]
MQVTENRTEKLFWKVWRNKVIKNEILNFIIPNEELKQLFSNKHDIYDIEPRILLDAIKIHPMFPILKDEYVPQVNRIASSAIDFFYEKCICFDLIEQFFIDLYGKGLFTNQYIRSSHLTCPIKDHSSFCYDSIKGSTPDCGSVYPGSNPGQISADPETVKLIKIKKTQQRMAEQEERRRLMQEERERRRIQRNRERREPIRTYATAQEPIRTYAQEPIRTYATAQESQQHISKPSHFARKRGATN